MLLQAVEGGLDIVTIAGCSVNDTSQKEGGGVVARTGVDIKGAKDFEGKRVGVPGLGAYMHVLFRRWLVDKGADDKKVNFVEVPFAQGSDILKAGNVDALLTGDPFYSRIVQSKTGYLVSPYLAEMPDNLFSIYFAATRSWADKNPAAIKAFREALAEGTEFLAEEPGARPRDRRQDHEAACRRRRLNRLAEAEDRRAGERREVLDRHARRPGHHQDAPRCRQARREPWRVTAAVLPAASNAVRRGDALIAFRGVSLSLGGRLILEDIDLDMRRREFICVVGPSGCGKTTLLRLIAGLLHPDKGEVIYNGKPVAAPASDIALIFQDYSKALLPWRTASGNVVAGLRGA